MVKTRKNPAEARRIKYALDAEAIQRLIETSADLSTRCKSLQSSACPLTFLDCFEVSTSSFDLCPICSNTFGSAVREPICLPCGHTICRECTTKIRQTPTRGMCPYDRKEFFTQIDALPVNFAILSMIDSRTKIVKRLCCRHKKELIGYSPDDDELLCGVCLFEKKGQVCYQFTSEQARCKSTEKRQEVENASKALITQQELWSHCQAITDLTLNTLKTFEETSEEKPLTEMAKGLRDVFAEVSGKKQEHLAELERVMAGWEAMSFPEKLSCRIVVPDEISLATECMKTMTTILKATR